MAYKVSVKGMDKLEKAFENGVKGVTGCMKRSVYSGADVIADSVRANLAGALKRAEVKGYQIILTSHGDLEKSLTISRIVTIGGTVQTKVGFGGYDRKGVPNTLKAGVLESGRSKQDGRTKTHFFSNAVKSSRKPARNAMREEFLESFKNSIGE